MESEEARNIIDALSQWAMRSDEGRILSVYCGKERWRVARSDGEWYIATSEEARKRKSEEGRKEELVRGIDQMKG